ncbi:SurA N-terminal domain-containing protein [Pillotina sp. SPG140]
MNMFVSLIVILLSVSCAAQRAQKPTQPVTNIPEASSVSAIVDDALKPVALVHVSDKSEVITVGSLQNEVERRAGISTLSDIKLLAKVAEQDASLASTVDQQLAQARSSIAQQLGRGPTEAEFDQAVRANTGMTVRAYRDQVLAQLYLQNRAQTQLQAIQEYTPEQIGAVYEARKSEFVRPQTVRLSLISVPFGGAASDKSAARVLADRLSASIGFDAGNFDETVLMAQVPNAGYEAGDAGFIPRNEQAYQLFGVPFIETVFRLSQGEVSPVIEGTSSFYIAKITGKYEQTFLEIDDLIQLNPPTTVYDYIRTNSLQQQAQPILIQARQEVVKELKQNTQLYQQCLDEVRADIRASAPQWTEILNGLIDEILLVQAAERDKITVSTAEIEQQIQQFRAAMTVQFGRTPTDAEFLTAVESEIGLDLAAFSEQIRRQILSQKYITSKRQTYSNPSEQEILDMYNANRTTFIRPQTIKYNAIIGTTRESIQQLIAEIGKDVLKFDSALQRLVNTGTYTIQEGALLAQTSQATQIFDQQSLNTIFSLWVHEVSPLLSGPLGYAIIKITEVYDQKFLDLNEPVQLGNAVTVKEYIKSTLSQSTASYEQTRRNLIDELRKDERAYRIYTENIPRN